MICVVTEGKDFIRVITDVRGNEPDVLSAVKHDILTVTHLDNNILFNVAAPVHGWTTDLLWDATDPIYAPLGADAYVGKQWIGSTEV